MTIGRVLLYLASAGAIGLLLRSLWQGAVPLGVALAAFLGYFALALIGVLVPQLEMFADVFWKGRRDVPEMALTFDDGPHPEHTVEVLELLEKAGVKATFFVLGSRVEAHPEVLRKIVAQGHEVGIHGYTHDRLFSLRGTKRIISDLERALTAVQRVTGRRPALFRPPVGHVSPRTDTAATKLDLTIVAWSVRGLDGLEGAKASKVAGRVRRGLRPGAVVLLHDAPERGERRPAGVDALPSILEAMDAQGLRSVGVTKLIEGLVTRKDS